MAGWPRVSLGGGAGGGKQDHQIKIVAWVHFVRLLYLLYHTFLPLLPSMFPVCFFVFRSRIFVRGFFFFFG
jgi:hypothetical protein